MSDGGFYHTGSGADDNTASSSDELSSKERGLGNTQKIDSDTEDRLTPQDLYHAEGGKSLAERGVVAAASLTPYGKAIKFVSNHKKGIGFGGGGAIGFIIALVAFFGFLASYELVTIEKDLLRYEEKAVAYVVKKAANSIMSHMYCRGVTGSLSNSTGCVKPNASEGISEENGTQTEANKATMAAQEQDPMTAEIDAFKFTDPQVSSALSQQGIQVQESGNQIKFQDVNTGKLVTYDDLESPDMVARFQTAIPDFNIGQMKAMRGMLTLDEGADWNPIPSPEDNAEDDVKADINGTATNEAQQLQEAQAEDETNGTNNSGGSQTATTNQQLTSEDNKILQAADTAIAEGEPEAVVIQRAEAAVAPDLGNSLTITAIVSTLCSIASAASSSSLARIPTILSFLVRHSSTLLGFADEMKVPGKLSGKQIAATTNLFNGNTSVKSNSKYDSTLNDASMSFSQSASWQRISGNPVNTNKSSPGYNPDFTKSLLPLKNSGQSVVNSIDGFLRLAGGAFICSLLTNKIFSHVFGFMGIVATGTIDIASLGTAQIAIGAGTIAFSEVSQHVLIPEIVKYFTPVAINGLENSVQWMNNADAGTNIAFNMYAQRLGGVPMSSTQAADLYSKGVQLANVEESHKPFLTRTFSFSDPSSLVSRLAVKLPLSQLGIINSIIGDIIRMPSLLFHSFGALIGGKALAAQVTDPGAPYDITQYGFTSSEITKYDPVTNEYFLFHTQISYKKASATLIQLLGNPNNYPNGSYDTNQSDLLHCFALSPYSPNGQQSSQLWIQQSDQSAPDPICGTMGNLSTDTAPVDISASGVAANVVCPALGYPGDQKCISMATSVLSEGDVINRYRQYILDDEVTNYISAFQSSSS